MDEKSEQKSVTVSNILKFLINTNPISYIIVDDIKVPVVVEDIRNNTNVVLKIHTKTDEIKTLKGVNCFINSGKDTFFFSSDITKVENERIYLMIPSTITKLHSREYQRYNVDGLLYMSMNVIKEVDKTMLDFRVSKSYKSLFKDILDITYEEAIESVITHLKKYFQTAIFIEPHSTLPWLNYCKETKSKLLVLDITNEEGLLQKFSFKDFTSYIDFIKHYEKISKSRNVKFFVEYHLMKNLRSFIYIPLFTVDTLIGYLLVGNSKPEIIKSDLDFIKFYEVIGFCDLIEQFFCIDRFFRITEYKDYPIPVVDISFGGIKIKIDKHIAHMVDIGDEVKVYLKVGARNIELLSKVIRIGIENNEFVMAMKFMDMNREKFLHIKKWFSQIERW